LLILNPHDLKSDFSDSRVEGAPSSPLRFVNPVRDRDEFTSDNLFSIKPLPLFWRDRCGIAYCRPSLFSSTKRILI
jgi:hypothetical protein